MTKKEEKAYKYGFIDGLQCYAHWLDGKQLVGIGGTTLEEAIREIEKMWNYYDSIRKNKRKK